MDSGIVGLVLTHAMTLMAIFQWAVRQSSEVESLVSISWQFYLYFNKLFA